MSEYQDPRVALIVSMVCRVLIASLLVAAMGIAGTSRFPMMFIPTFAIGAAVLLMELILLGRAAKHMRNSTPRLYAVTTGALWITFEVILLILLAVAFAFTLAEYNPGWTFIDYKEGDTARESKISGGCVAGAMIVQLAPIIIACVRVHNFKKIVKAELIARQKRNERA